jgi:hypothetical protein
LLPADAERRRENVAASKAVTETELERLLSRRGISPRGIAAPLRGRTPRRADGSAPAHHGPDPTQEAAYRHALHPTSSEAAAEITGILTPPRRSQ